MTTSGFVLFEVPRQSGAIYQLQSTGEGVWALVAKPEWSELVQKARRWDVYEQSQWPVSQKEEKHSANEQESLTWQ